MTDALQENGMLKEKQLDDAFWIDDLWWELIQMIDKRWTQYERCLHLLRLRKESGIDDNDPVIQRLRSQQ